MKLILEKNEHLYYASIDKNFCKAKPYSFKKSKSIVKKANPLEQYKKKLRIYLKKNKR